MAEPPPVTAWLEQRRLAISAHAAAHQRRRAAEAEQARQHIAEFLAQARERGLRTRRLVARGYPGGAAYRTGRWGWYVHSSRLYAIGDDGEFYFLSVRASLRARFTGVVVAPSEPKLVVGEGGRDGESIPLRTLLQRRLAAGDDWP